jgi:ankyrin repeat protein
VDLETRQNAIARPLCDTSTWVFEMPEYIGWLERRNISKHKGLLWIKGKPGSGKSVMMKQMLIQAETKQLSASVINFFFNARGTAAERKPIGLFRSLLHQLFRRQRPLLASFLPKFRTKRDTLKAGWEWQEGELSEYLSDVVTSAQVSSMIVFIDALDECEHESDIRRLVTFFSTLTSSAVSSNCKLNVCMSSRHYPHISVSSCEEIFMERWNTPDILKYVESELRLEDMMGQTFQEEVSERASGVFLWVVLVVASLVKEKDEGRTVREMRQTLQAVPEELHQIFTGYFETVSARDRLKTLKLMELVLFAQRPLTIMELNCALAFSAELPHKSHRSWQHSDDYADSERQIERRFRTLSKGLLEFKDLSASTFDRYHSDERDASTRCVVQFIHESIRDFLLHHNGLQIIGSTSSQHSLGRSQDLMVRTCINYLSIEELQSAYRETTSTNELLFEDDREYAALAKKKFQQYHFWNYAVRWLFTHVSEAEAGGIDQRYLARVLHSDSNSLFQVWRCFYDWLMVADYGEVQGPETMLLHIASEHGVRSCVAELLSSAISPNVKGGRFLFALIAAASQGHHSTVELLLKNGAEMEVKGKYGRTALHWAAHGGHLEIVRLLLGEGMSVMLRDRNGRTALHTAAASRDDNLSMLELLIDRGADITARDEEAETALHLAVENGHQAMVRLLLDTGANVAAKNKEGETALYGAARKGDENMLALLLENGADVTVKNKSGATILQEAAASWRESEVVIQLLIEKGLSVTAKDKNGVTALHEAVGKGKERTTRLLLHSGADVAAKDREGQTALHFAAGSGNEATVMLLIQEGLDMAAIGTNEATVLHKAAGNRTDNEAIPKMLVDKGLDMEAKDKDGLTALHCAARVGNKKIVKWLLDTGVDTTTKDKNRATVLHQAVSSRDRSTVILVLETMENVDVKDGDGATALYRAAQHSDNWVMMRLLERGADATVKDKYGGTILHIAARWKQNKSMIELLINKGVDIAAKDKDGRTLLHPAAEHGHLEIINRLIKSNMDPSAQDKDGMQPIHLAAQNGYLEVVNRLVALNADPSARHNDGWQPIHAAAQNGYLKVVNRLIELNADPSARHNGGWQPIHTAALDGHLEVVNRLIALNADPSARDNGGWQPIHAAAQNGHLEVVNRLIELNADPSARDNNGRQPIHAAARNGHVEVTCRLLEDVSVNGKDILNRTPLHYAIYRSHENLAELLLAHGANALLIDCYGRSSLDWASEHELLFTKMTIQQPEHAVTSLSEQYRVLRESVRFLSRTLMHSSGIDVFYELGYCLLFLQDLDNASKAFEQQIITSPKQGVVTHNVSCDFCFSPNIRGMRYICRTCPDIDLCSSCMETYENASSTRRCRHHDFLQIPSER